MTRSGQQDLRICRRASLSGMSRSATSTASARAYARSVGPAQDIDGIVIRAGTPAAGTLWSGVWGSKPITPGKNHNARMRDRPRSGVQCPVLVPCNKVLRRPAHTRYLSALVYRICGPMPRRLRSPLPGVPLQSIRYGNSRGPQFYGEDCTCARLFQVCRLLRCLPGIERAPAGRRQALFTACLLFMTNQRRTT